jgi:hypothetical protein
MFVMGEFIFVAGYVILSLALGCSQIKAANAVREPALLHRASVRDH